MTFVLSFKILFLIPSRFSFAREKLFFADCWSVFSRAFVASGIELIAFTCEVIFLISSS